MLNKFEVILNSIADGVFTIDTNWRIESFNAAAERITGFTAEEAIGKVCREIFRANMETISKWVVRGQWLPTLPGN